MIRMHVALDTPQLDAATDFYRALFDAEPTLTAPDYARFVLDEPGLVLTLNAGRSAGRGRLNHMGIRVDDAAAVRAARGRLIKAGLSVRDENTVDCCYALQDKLWVADPDGNPWEVYTVLQADTRPQAAAARAEGAAPSPCCDPAADTAPADAPSATDEAPAAPAEASGACCPPTCCP